METKYVFLDEQGTDITGIAAPYDIGDKIINVNGEFEVIGLVNDIVTTKTITIFDRLFTNRKTEDTERNYKQRIILQKIKKA